MKIGILASGITPDELLDDFGSYADMIQALLHEVDSSIEFAVYDVRDGIFPDSASTCDAWALTGSKSCVGENLPWMVELKSLIVDIYHAKIPTIGICFGHQIIAEALGGRVEPYKGGWGVGLHHYQTVSDNPLFTALGDGFTLNAMHQDQVVEVPESAEVIASSAFCQFAALNYANCIFTVQAHPEFSNVFEYLLVSARQGSVVPDALAKDALAGLRSVAASSDSLRLAQCMTEFLYQQ